MRTMAVDRRSPIVLVVAIAAALYIIMKGKATPKPVTYQLPSVPVPPGTMTQPEVDIIQRGNADELARTALDGTHGKTFVAAAAARLAGLGDARALQVGQYALTLPNQEDAKQ
jgi:hypothetical protein